MPLILSEMYLLIDQIYILRRHIMILALISLTSQLHVDNVNIQCHQTYVNNKYVMRNHASNASNLKF